jgi:[protein-PII] uridylyltransferase
MYGTAVATDRAALPGGAAALLEQARRGVQRDILAGESAVSALERYSAFADRELQRLAATASVSGGPVALIALGGYGRRHLCPYSDLDLLVLFGGPVGEAEEQFLRQLLHPLWDAGFVVGQHVREARELDELGVDNPEFLLALLDARLVAGDATLHRRLLDAFHVPRTHADVLAALQALVDARYTRFNGTLYQLEPDVKEAPGSS